MKTSRFRIPLLGLFFSASLAALSSCDERAGFSRRPAPAGVPAANAEPASRGASELAEAKVAIEDFKFEPEKLSVRAGTKVTWVNKDDEPHSATSSEKPKRFDSGALDTTQSFSFTFTEQGSYSYFCKLHPHMTGVVVVQ